MSIRELVVKPGPYANIHLCDELSKAVYYSLSSGKKFKSPLQWFCKDLAELIANNCNAHCVYMLELDQVAHHFVLETHHGKARLFQSSIKTRITSILGAKHVGYSAGEWASAEPVDSWDPVLKVAHRRWGGGRQLEHKSLQSLLDLLLSLQKASSDVAEILFSQCPKWLQDAELKGDYDASGHTPVMKWSRELMENASWTSVSSLPDGRVVVSSNPHSAIEFSMVIPADLAIVYQQLYSALTGQAPMYAPCLHYRGCETRRGVDPESGIQNAVGWAVKCVTIPH
jgi:hypothetical protein